MTYRQATKIVLGETDRHLTLHEIHRQIIKRQLRKNVIASGLRSVLNKDYQRGNESDFIRGKRGRYSLRHKKDTLRTKQSSYRDKILVFDTTKLKDIETFHGIRDDADLFIRAILENDNPVLIDRETAEKDDHYKQVVSYIIIKYNDKLLRFVRHESKINKFLDYVDGKRSIGFGGHVQSGDINLWSYEKKDSGYYASVKREIKEETGINIENAKGMKLIGVLNDDSTPRGLSHFAFIHLLELSEPNFKAREVWVSELELVSFDQLSAEFVEYEYWSKLCLQHYFGDKLTHKCFIDTKKNFSLRDNSQFLAVVGGIGSGKSQICSILERKYGYVNIPCSQILKDILGLQATSTIQRRDLQDAGYEFIEMPGAHKKFAEKIVQYLEKVEKGSRFLFDGIRYTEILIEIERILGIRIPVLYVENPIEMRYQLFTKRENRELEFSDFLGIVEHPVEDRVEEFLPLAKIMVYNFNPLDSLSSELSDYFQRELVDTFLWDSWDINAKNRHEQILRGNDITYHQVLVPSIIRRLKEVTGFPALKVLDVGCGTGVMTKFIADNVEKAVDIDHSKVVGIDHSYESVRIARKYLKDTNVKLKCIAIENFMWDDKFDVIVANMTLHTVKTLKSSLVRLYQCLKKDGRFIFTIPHPRYYPMRDRFRDIFLAGGYEYDKESYHEIPFSIEMEPEPLPSPIPYFHRSLHVYESLLNETGFWLIEIEVPIPEDCVMNKYKNKWTLPHVLLGVAKKH